MKFIFKTSLILFSFLANYNISIAQFYQEELSNGNNFQYGVSLKASFELNAFTRKHSLNGGNHLFRIGINFGIGYAVTNYIYPSYNLEVQLYRGGHGSRAISPIKQKHYISADLINALTLTAPFSFQEGYLFTKNNLYSLENRYIPLYYFADFALPSLQNPFSSSFSLGTNFIVPIGEGKKWQRIGFVNFHIQNFQFSYYNDGGWGIAHSRLGDREDRYYTGGGVFSYSLGFKHEVNLIEVGFHKYTGFSENAFQISNELNLGSVNYKDVSQHYYNKGYIGFTAVGLKKGVGFTVKLNNGFLEDFQHKIHYAGDYAYHEVPYRRSISIGAGYYFNNNYLKIK